MFSSIFLFGSLLLPPTAEYDIPRPGCSLHVREFGQGPALVVLAGGPGLNANYMEGAYSELTKDHRCIVPDQRGTGGSKLAKIDGTTLRLDLYIADLEALREKLGQDRLAILGHSWGAMLAMAYAAEHPEHIDRLVLAGSGGPSAKFLAYVQDNFETRLWPEDRELLGAAKDKPDRVMLSMQARMPQYFFSHEEGVKARALIGPDTVTPGISGLVIGQLSQGYDLTPKLRGLHAPTLIIQGRQDPMGESTAVEIHEAIPGSRLVWLERCGHFGWVEARDRFFEEVRGFLDGERSEPRAAPGPKSESHDGQSR